ncbi:MAG: sulfatase-like hydrolase/transferase [Kordiimonadaceae bacterium]|nr:sulfatase-like hydrolase/transferase [Kordiimonadaceae bacterium]MBO6570068.1 sulfatase-like hydrolase/transferase [Kordiimonadaceae bacterium]MBO6965835.1 sulfatase-like hydrolase/transferase [Kordiimonadaceae bacterium]
MSLFGRLTKLLCLLALFALPATAEDRPNIVLMYVDDLGYGDLASYGHPIIETPNIDALAADGLKLTSFYAPSPLCSPSRAALMTGRTPYRTGIKSWIPENTPAYLSENEITIATWLKDTGYQTAIVGKWHLNGGLSNEDHAQPRDHGFDHTYVLHAFPLPHQNNPTNFYANGEPLGEVKGFTAQIVADEAMRWMDEREEDAPFFLYVPFIEPHGTIHSPEHFLEKYERYTKGEPIPVVNDQPGFPEGVEARGPGEYYANVSFLDEQVGRLLEYLDANGLRDNTVVMFFSDNGPVTIDWRAWWEVNLYGDTGGYRGRKADLYEGGIRVPGMIRFPGVIDAGQVSDYPVSGYDIFPTLTALLGLDMPTGRAIDGIDISPLFEGQTPSREKPLFWAFPAAKGGPHYVVLQNGWKLLATEDVQPMALYNLAADRYEMNDLRASNPEKTAELLLLMQDYIADVAADPLRPEWDTQWRPQN